MDGLGDAGDLIEVAEIAPAAPRLMRRGVVHVQDLLDYIVNLVEQIDANFPLVLGRPGAPIGQSNPAIFRSVRALKSRIRLPTITINSRFDTILTR